MNTSTRDLLNHGNGKGDAPRTKLDKNYRDRFAFIDFGGKDRTVFEGFVRKGNKWVKRF